MRASAAVAIAVLAALDGKTRIGNRQVVPLELGKGLGDIGIPFRFRILIAEQIDGHHILRQIGRLLDLEDEGVGSEGVQDAAWNEPEGPRYGGGLSSGAARRIPNARKAMLYALDGQTGKELWNSGDTITSWNHFSGITVANGRVYIGTWDGMLYAFGVR